MKYTCEVEIAKPIDEVMRAFHNPDNYEHWMKGLLSYTIIHGSFGEPGTEAELEFALKKGSFAMREKVLVSNLPQEYTVHYQTKGVINVVKSTFEELSPTLTRYISENEVVFQGGMKFFGFIMPGSFKRQSQKYLNDFKSFVENK